ncbi:MAG: SNF2-related protein, partial [Bacilli bacterium]|nr:SNF2-related protein [Bacilli bacterium]
PESYIEKFMNYLLDACSSKVEHNVATGSWTVKHYSRYWSPKLYNTYGTNKISATRIIEDTLNGREIAVRQGIRLTNGKKSYVLNQDETNLAVEKQRIILEEFQNWIKSNPDVESELSEIYYEKFGCIKRRAFDGSFLTLPGLSQDVELFDYQKDAAARMILAPNTLLAHDVGSGKTYEMIAAGMELKRMGLSTKNLYAVPNGIVNQWRSTFKKMYPDSKLLVIKPSSFSPDKRQGVMKQIRESDYDAIIMAHSCFDMMTVSTDFEYQEIMRRRDELVLSISNGGATTNQTIPNKIKELDKKLAKLAKPAPGFVFTQENNEEKPISFEELGITRLFIDEAHVYKNVPFETKMSFVSGLNPSGSEKCKRMVLKVRSVQRNNNGGGVVMATGTPITNSISDCFIFQSYLQKGELDLLGISDFDSWAMMFAEVKHEVEVSVDTNSFKIGTRFGKFHNLPELASLLSNIADFHHMDNSEDLPTFNGYTDVVIKKTPEFQSFLDDVSKRADAIKKRNATREKDNMLKITTDGRKAALDLRLVGRYQPLMYSKSFECAVKVADLYFKTLETRSTQLIFSDISTPSNGFNVYDEIKQLLESFNIPSEEIAFIHDYESEIKRNLLFDGVNNGAVRIVLGSTSKLGMGVNVQERLVAIHHLSIPWRPSDMVQREGRIIRPGNTSKEVHIYRYITENSFDAYSWQLLETKQNFISKLLSCNMTDRDADDVDDSVLDYATVKALAIANPLMRERVEAYNQLQRYKNLNVKAIEERNNLKLKLVSNEQRLPVIMERLQAAKTDLDFLNKNPDVMTNEEKKGCRDALFQALQKNLDENIEAEIGVYRGFGIWSPQSHSDKSTYMYLKRDGRYPIEASTSPIGMITRIDNFLDRFERTELSLEKELDRTLFEIDTSKKELRNKVGFADQIDIWRKRLAELDKQIGLENV